MIQFFMFFSLLGIPSESDTLYTEKIEARVGGQIITSSEVANEMQKLQAAADEEKSQKTLKKRALSSLIELALVKEYLRRMQMDVTDQDVERRINSIRAAQGAASISEFSQMLASQGLSFDEFKKQVKEQMQLGQFYQIVQRKTLQTMDEKDLMAYYQNNQDKFSSKLELRIQECFIPFEGQRDKVMKLAKKFESQPSSFNQCVSLHSRSPSAQKNGDLGKVTRGLLRPEVESQIFKASKGDVVVIELPGAVQLIRVTEVNNLGPQDFESVKPEIEKAITDQRIAKAREKLMTELKASTFIQVDS